MNDPKNAGTDPLEQPFVRGVIQEAKSDFRTSLRWAKWGAALGAVALGGAGFWYFSIHGLAVGAAVGAVGGGLGAWILYASASSVFS